MMIEANRLWWVRAILICLCASYGATAALAVIPNNNPEAYTEKQFRQAFLAYNQRTLSEAYLKVGKRDPKWDDLVVELLDGKAVGFANHKASYLAKVPSVMTTKRRVELVKRLNKLNCDDPLAQYIILLHSKDTDERYRIFARKVLQDMLASDYPINRKAAAAWRVANILEKHKLNDEAQQAVQTWIDLFCKAATDPKRSLQDQYFLFWAHQEALTDDTYLRRWAEVCKRIDLPAAANPWLVGVICGYYHVEAGWEARGSGYARTVTDEGWKSFKEHLDLAREHLVKAWEIAPQFPNAPGRMITVSMGLGDRQERLWFERAVNAQFDYYPAYTSYLWAIRPRWRGSLNQMYAFGVECLKTDRFDTRVPTLFYKVMDDIHEETKDYSYWLRKGVYENFITYYDGRKGEVGQEDQQAWWDSMKAATAWRCRRMPEAVAMLDQLGDDFIPRVFKKVGAHPAVSTSEVYARTGPAAEAVVQADQMWAKQRFREAMRTIESASQEFPPDHPALTYLAYYATRASRKHQDVKGVWVDLLGRPDLNGWGVYRGDWEVDDQGRLIGTSDNRGMELMCWYDFGYEVEIEGTITFLAPAEEQLVEEQGQNAGILFGYYWKSPHSYHHDFLLDKDRQSVVTMRHLFYDKWDRPAKIEEKTNRFHLQVWQQHIRLTVNDELVIDNWVMPRKLPRSQKPFAIGGLYKKEGARVRFDELKARRLKQRPDWAADIEDAVTAMALP